MSDTVHHPLFAARIYQRTSDQAEKAGQARKPRFAKFQRIVTRSGAWPLVAGGCHADRDTAAAIERAGFEIDSCRRFSFTPTPLVAPAAPRILGTARRPSHAG